MAAWGGQGADKGRTRAGQGADKGRTRTTSLGPRGLLGGVPHPPSRVPYGDRPWPMVAPPSLPPLAARPATCGQPGGPAHVAPKAVPGNVPHHRSRPDPPPSEDWPGGTHPNNRPRIPDVRHGVWRNNPRPRAPGSLLRSPSTRIPPPRGLLHPGGRAAQCQRPANAGTLGPHGRRDPGMAPVARCHATAPSGGPGPPMATGPQDVGARPNMAGHHHSGHGWAGGQDHPRTGGVPAGGPYKSPMRWRTSWRS